MSQLFGKDRAPQFPMLGFVYNREGRYTDPTKIKNDYELLEFLQNQVALAFVERREIRITDRTADDMLFHLLDGKVLWVGGGDTEETQAMLKLMTDDQFPAPPSSEDFSAADLLEFLALTGSCQKLEEMPDEETLKIFDAWTQGERNEAAKYFAEVLASANACEWGESYPAIKSPEILIPYGCRDYAAVVAVEESQEA